MMYKLKEIAEYFNRPIQEIVSTLALYGHYVAPNANEHISEKMRVALIRRYGKGPFHISATGDSHFKPIIKMPKFNALSKSQSKSTDSQGKGSAADADTSNAKVSLQSSGSKIGGDNPYQDTIGNDQAILRHSEENKAVDHPRNLQIDTQSDSSLKGELTPGKKSKEEPRFLDYVVCPSCKVGGYMYCPKCLGAGGWYELRSGFPPVYKAETIGEIQRIHKRFNLALKQPLWSPLFEVKIQEDVEFLSTKIQEEGVKELLECIENARSNRHRYKMAIRTKELSGKRVDQVISLVNGFLKNIGNQRLFRRKALNVIEYVSKMNGAGLPIPMASLSLVAERLVSNSSAVAIDARITFQLPDIGEAVARGDLSDYYIIILDVNGRQKKLFITDESVRQAIGEATLK